MEQKNRIYFDDSTSIHLEQKATMNTDEKSSPSIWKPVTIGTFSAIMFTTVSAFVMKRLEERDEANLSDAENVIITNEIKPEQDFENAFTEARQQRGSQSAFTWKGNVYSTSTREEWEQLPDEIKEEIIEQIDPDALDVIDVNDNYAQDDHNVSVEQTIGLDDANTIDSEAKDMVYTEEDTSASVIEDSSDEVMAMNDGQEPSVVIVEEGNDDLDDDVHIVSSGEISDVEVMMLINGNENQDVFIVDVDDGGIEENVPDIINMSENQVDISTQVDYVDPNVIDGDDGVDVDEMYFT